MMRFLKTKPSFQYNIWMHIYADRYEELFSYSMKQVNDETIAEEITRELSVAYFKNEKLLAEELNKFSDLCQQIVTMHFYDKKTVVQIARELSLKYYQVKPKLDKTIAHLRQNINPGYYEKIRKRLL
jgi:DNA-directed RNA polymerase specialized sigma subunit